MYNECAINGILLKKEWVRERERQRQRKRKKKNNYKRDNMRNTCVLAQICDDKVSSSSSNSGGVTTHIFQLKKKRNNIVQLGWHEKGINSVLCIRLTEKWKPNELTKSNLSVELVFISKWWFYQLLVCRAAPTPLEGTERFSDLSNHTCALCNVIWVTLRFPGAIVLK